MDVGNKEYPVKENGTDEQPVKKNLNRVYVLVGIIIALVGLVVYFFLENSQLKQVRQQQGLEIAEAYLRLDSVSNELEQRIVTIRDLGGEVDTLVAFVAQLEVEKKSLFTQGKNQKERIARLNKKVEGYKELLLAKDEEILKLKAINEQLATENTTLKVEKNELNDSIRELQQNTEILEGKVAVASQLEIQGLTVYAVNSKGKERRSEFRNRQINQIKVQFLVMDNEIAPIEGKELLLRIVAPDGNTLFDVSRGSGSFTYKGRELFYTVKQEILYDKKKQLVTYLYDNGSDYSIGKHQIEVYTDGYLMGSGFFTVK